jgi:hypothetical protein
MENLIFDFDRGIIYRFVKKYNTYDIAGYKQTNGYIYIMIYGKKYGLHRVLYQKYHNIELKPDQQIDHINGIRDDNRICNLRIATRSQNCQNTKCRNRLGHKHIFLTPSGNYRVLIESYKFKTICKNFKTLEEAIEFRNNQYKYINDKYGCYYQISSSASS